MLRREVRLRREYLYRKAQEDRQRTIEDKKQKLKGALDENRLLPTEVRREALQLQKLLEYDDGGAEGVSSHMDDEYKWAGVEDPKVMVTTSRDPSSRLKMFAKEVKLMFPGAQRMNRGGHEIVSLVKASKANNVTDLVIVHETRGQPDGLVVCHLPFGPTAYFTLYNVVMRHDVPDIGTMSEAYPHLIFHNFTSRLGKRVRVPQALKILLMFSSTSAPSSTLLPTQVSNILKYLFPVPKEDSRRVITFANQDDFITFRHHTYKKTDHRNVELTEVGPRFDMKLYMIKLGTLENESTADVEWRHHGYTHTAKKRRFLSVQ
ncbi:U3 small nucleolar ribonucleoprotein protein IMP4 isoform X1 [Antennarius striatus]|uniref:U3 small nucleolar ribonucleoprotein protein IMP4 isoform X1 n=1 Tax=Antennarius striatus TaxID=241820 RepID=UPI0035B26725